MGFTDMCIGMHTVTDVRVRLTPFFVVQLNPLYLVTKLDDDPDFMVLVFRTFKPMQDNVWPTFVLVIIVSAVVVTLQERVAGAQPQGWEDRLSAHDQSPEAGRLEHLKENVIINLRTLYDGAVGNSSSAAALISQLGLGFFILLLTSAYTANLTTFLVTSQQQGRINSWAEAQERGVSVCGTRMGSLTARTVYPTANWAIDPEDGMVGVKTGANVLKYLSQGGICDAAVIDHEDLYREHMAGEVSGPLTSPHSLSPYPSPSISLRPPTNSFPSALRQSPRGRTHRLRGPKSLRTRPAGGCLQNASLTATTDRSLARSFSCLHGFVSIVLFSCLRHARRLACP